MNQGVIGMKGLIPLFIPLSTHEFAERFQLKLRHRSPVTIAIPTADLTDIDRQQLQNGTHRPGNNTVQFTVTQYRADHRDGTTNRTTLSAWVYLDETANQIIAIDGTAQNIYRRSERYAIEDTPFRDILLFGTTE